MLNMRAVTILGCLLLLPLGAEAQVVQSDAVSGPWISGLASWGSSISVSAGPFIGGAFSFSVPTGSGLLDWNAFSSSLYGLGWTLGGQSRSSMFLLGLIPETAIVTYWDGDEFKWEFNPAYAFLTTNRLGPLIFGGGALETSGELHLSDLKLGNFQAVAGGVFVGLPCFWLFYGEAEADVAAKLNFLSYSPFQVQGALIARAMGFWSHSEWSLGEIHFGLGAGAGLLWVDDSLTIATAWPTVVFWPPSITINSTQTGYAFAANPAWGFLLHPQVFWEPAREWRVELSRWLPITGGWAIQQGSSPVAGNSSGPSSTNALSSTDALNFWLAGLDLRITYRW